MNAARIVRASMGFVRFATGLGVLIAVATTGGTVHAAAFTVNSLLDTTNNADGVCTIREAIINANNDAATWTNCPAGTGADTISFNVAGAITLTASLPNITDIDGLTIDGGNAITISGNNSFRIVTVNANVPVTFEDITLTAGNGSTGAGGAIDNNGGDITLTNATFSANITSGAGDNGGAIYNRNNGALIITDSDFSANQASAAGNSDGGAIYSTGAGSSVNITNSVFNGNISSDDGGAVFVNSGTFSADNTQFINHNNAAIDNGGAIYLNGGTSTITNSTFTNNRARSTGDDGGAIYVTGAATVVTISSSTFSGNIADDDGGAIFKTGAGTLTINSSTLFDGNYSFDDGGAILMNAGALNVDTVTFQNQNNVNIDNGGAINVTGGTSTITNGTFTNNRAQSSGDLGGAIYMTGAASSVTVSNSGFTNNTADLDGGAIRVANGTLNVNSNSTFSGNLATRDGGAISVAGAGLLTVANSSFTTNTADDGGAIYSNAATLLTLTSVTFTGNLANGEADGDGGAVTMNSAAAGSSLTISGNVFSNNIANDDGGAIWSNAEPVSITGSTFANNQARSGNGAAEGGAIYNSANADATSIRLSTFNGNSAAATANVNARGGAVANYGAGFIFANDTFTANALTKSTAGAGNAQGGAVYAGATTTIHNVTFSGNSASESGTGSANGGGLFRAAGTTTVANTILTNGTENGAPGNCGGTITNGGNNIHFNGADCGAGFTNADPNLGALTGTPAYFPLNASSPAINTGSNAICATATTTNNESQNVVVRPIGANCEIGSYEVNNLPPTDISLSNNTIDENQPVGTLIGLLTTTDVDDLVFTYSLVNTFACPGPGNASFQIGGGSGDELQSASAFDFETTNSYTICIRTTDSAGNTYDEQFTIIVNDLNENPTDITLSNDTIDENQPVNTVIGTLSATDPDAGATFTFTLACTVPGPDDASFNINGTDLRSSASFDYETQNAFNICIRVTDNGGLTYDENFVITVNDLNENPTDISLSNNTIDENQPVNTVIGTLTATDPDAGATFTFTLACAVPGPDDASFNINGTDLRSSASFDYETQTVFNICIRVTDNGGLTYDENFIITINDLDDTPPYVIASTPANGDTLTPGPVQISVEFNEDVKNDGSAGAANNIANYLLVEAGVNAAFDSLSCAGGLVVDDTQITINAAVYTNSGGSGPFTATLDINGGIPLPVGSYRLFVCGTTSIEDLADNELNSGTSDAIIDFTVVSPESSLPMTGFPQGFETTLPAQPSELTYASYSDLWLEIPRLGVRMTIVGVPQTKDGWDVTWLDRDAGWLNGSAFPTWNGNSVITAHVWDALNRPGPFANLKNLRYGDQIKIHAFGQVYTYEIRESVSVTPTAYSSVFKHEEKSWITLVTCEGYKSATGEYIYRRMVRAVLVSVTMEK